MFSTSGMKIKQFNCYYVHQLVDHVLLDQHGKSDISKKKKKGLEQVVYWACTYRRVK